MLNNLSGSLSSAQPDNAPLQPDLSQTSEVRSSLTSSIQPDLGQTSEVRSSLTSSIHPDLSQTYEVPSINSSSIQPDLSILPPPYEDVFNRDMTRGNWQLCTCALNRGLHTIAHLLCSRFCSFFSSHL